MQINIKVQQTKNISIHSKAKIADTETLLEQNLLIEEIQNNKRKKKKDLNKKPNHNTNTALHFCICLYH